MRRYNPKEVEPKWQKIWQESRIYEATEDKSKPKRYVLEYFPYPSGAAMHVGHVRNYTIGDVVSRTLRMQGYNVLHPMGWDAFGLPAENYAIKTGISPQTAVAQNVENFKQQLMQMGFSYDWSREINSTDPNYYHWTQWFFLLLYKKGLAYQKESLQWWCPFDKTVLANEQVENGRCWRCGNLVEKKALKQWFFKITDYAERLEADLDNVNWSEAIKSMQRNWIGRSVGAEIIFETEAGKKIKVFTTRPDTIYGATFLVLAPEHPLVPEITAESHLQTVTNYVREAERKTEVDRMETERVKTGVFTGAHAINPASGEKIPIWVADYVLPGYGTGAIMAVPAHDQRDWEFAVNYQLPVKFVVEPTFGEAQGDDVQSEKVFVALRNPGNGSVLVLNWGPRQKNYGGNMMIGGTVESGEDHLATAEREIIEETGYRNFKLVKEAEFKGHGYFYSNTKNLNVHASGKGFLFDLVDEERQDGNLDQGEKGKFSISWQPINKVAAMLDDGVHEAMYRYLVLNEVYAGEGVMINSGKYDGLDSASARDKITADLAKKDAAKEKQNFKIRDWLISRQRYWGAPIPIIHCEKCGIVPVPEDQLPVTLPEVKSYEPSGDGRSPLANVPDFVNVKCPACGGAAQRETDTMDGFACSSWYFLRFADPHNAKKAFDEQKVKFWLPVDDYIGGAEHAVMHLLYARFWTKVMYDDGLISFDEPFTTLRNHGMILAPDGQKMSKSKGNTIEPDGLIDQGYGADAIRLMELFIGPWNQAANWSVEGLAGMFRFLQRVWTLVMEYQEANPAADAPFKEEQLVAATHRTIKKVTRDIEDFNFNTAIAALMAFTNELYKTKAEDGFASANGWDAAINTLVQLLAPFAPHIAEELWQELGHDTSVHLSPWPEWNDSLIKEDLAVIAVQVNGKIRGEITLPVDVSEEEAVAAAKEKAAPHLEGKELAKTIYVPGRLVSLVVR